MKKKLIIIGIIIILLILLIPIPQKIKDGGSTEYNAIIYKITKVHQITPSGDYNTGIRIKIFGKEVYTKINYAPEENLLTKEDIIDEETKLLFTIKTGSKDCVPVELAIYEDKYILYTDYKACRPNETCTDILKYSQQIEGPYDYDVLKILEISQDADEMTFSMDNLPEYEIYTGKDNHHYITGSNNTYLKELLDKLDINLKTCAKKDYKK